MASIAAAAATSAGLTSANQRVSFRQTSPSEGIESSTTITQEIPELGSKHAKSSRPKRRERRHSVENSDAKIGKSTKSDSCLHDEKKLCKFSLLTKYRAKSSQCTGRH
jgi:hypothetical protein